MRGIVIFWICETILLLPTLLFLEMSYALQCGNTLQLWGREFGQAQTVADIWGLATMLLVGLPYLHKTIESTYSKGKPVSSDDYLSYRAILVSILVLMRAAIALGAWSGCVYAHVVVYLVVVLPVRLVEHSSAKPRNTD